MVAANNNVSLSVVQAVTVNMCNDFYNRRHKGKDPITVKVQQVVAINKLATKTDNLSSTVISADTRYIYSCLMPSVIETITFKDI